MGQAEQFIKKCYRGNMHPRDFKWESKEEQQRMAKALEEIVSQDSHDAKAMYLLGRCYDLAQGVPKDYAAAFNYYQRAADCGSSAAMNNLGICYDEGQGVAKDSTHAVEWFLKAAELGVADAMDNLALCYFKGRGIKKDDNQAEFWCMRAKKKKAEKEKFADEISSLMPFVLNFASDDVQADAEPTALDATVEMKQSHSHYVELEKRMQELEKLSKQQHAIADEALVQPQKKVCADVLRFMDRCYHSEGDAEDFVWSSEDQRQQLSQHLEVILKDNPRDMRALYLYARCYELGMGVNKDYERAMVWMFKAADLGSSDAMLAIATNFKHGQGVVKDSDQAIMWYKKAAQTGNSEAMCHLAGCYVGGDGVPQSFERAAEWYAKAAEAGCALVDIYMDLT